MAKYSLEFKLNAVKEFKSSNKTPTEFASKYEISDSTFLIG